MEQGVILFFLVLIVVAKGATALSLGQRRKDLWEAEAEDGDVTGKLQAVEATRLQLEREQKALVREEQLLENDKNLLCLEIQKLGVEPVPESELDAIEAASKTVEMTGGDPPASSEPGAEEIAAAESEIPDGEEPPPGGAPGRPRILVVDDNEELRGLLHQILAKDYEVSVAADGLEALTVLHKEKQQFDLIVTDLKMPNVSGVSLLENLPKNVPAIVISAYVQRPEVQQALRERVSPTAVIQKPFKLSTLRKKIDEALQMGETAEPEASIAASTEDSDAG